ncbi:MAG: DUF2933 domain-containing protein [Candidatus Thermoplasmatota archaeon]|nr:DUF2933 domain-containing protein [Candidatus Thermoplasmatota archaeon]
MKRHYPVPHRHGGAVRTNLAVLAFFATAAFFLLTEHRAHLFGALPFLLLLACLPLHFFMHRGHGGNGEHRHSHDNEGDQA